MAVLAKNKQAYFDYEIQETLEAGISLMGHEVKSAKTGNVSLKGSHVAINRGQANLVNLHISPYKYAGALPEYDPTRSRKLLLNRKEIDSIIGKYKIAGYAIVPLELYTKKGLIKVKLGIARGKKKWDKRESIKRREAERKIKRAIRSKY